MPRHFRIPSYRLHKQSGQAVVTFPDGLGHRRDVLLGPFGSSESRAEYARVLAEWEACGRLLPTPRPGGATSADVTINEIALAYWRHVETYYVKDGRPTSEQTVIKHALRFLKNLYGHTSARDFGPLALKAVRKAMIEHPITCKVKVKDVRTGKVREEAKVLRQGLTRKNVNKQVGRIKRLFAWAVEEELVPVEVYQSLRCVKGLRKGQAREKPRVKPVPVAVVEATLPFLHPVVRTMVQVQLLTGCRPQDVVQMRLIDIDVTGPVWEYRPRHYKTEHRNEQDDPDRERAIFLGPRTQGLLKPYFTTLVTDYLFSPTRAEQVRAIERRKDRRTPHWPSHLKLLAAKRKSRRARAPKDHYTVASYRRAVERACAKAGVEVWTPLQLRHARGTEVRKRYGLEASQAVLGHAELGVTQVYAEVDLATARRIMAEIG
jgi:integrase